MDFSVKEFDEFTLVEFRLEELITPEQLPHLLEMAPRVDPTRGVVISGRGPIWLHSALAHLYHPTKWVSHYDPRLGGAVVVQTHHPNVRVGQVIEVRGGQG